MVLAVSMVAAMGLAGCGNNSTDDTNADSSAETENTESSSEYKLVFSGSDLANPWVVMVKDGFEAAAKTTGSSACL